MEKFEDNFFFGTLNRFSGSGGEILVKGEGNTHPTRMEVGDRLIGIGIAERVEALDGADSRSFHLIGADQAGDSKMALRAFAIAEKKKTWRGYVISLSPLEPKEYSALVDQVSGGAVKIAPETIPRGTMILSFIDPQTTYTLAPLKEGNHQNWINASKGERHWNVGIGSPDDFWIARFPLDDIRLLKYLPQWLRLGGIWFGLSLLPGSKRSVDLAKVPHHAPITKKTKHDFCLKGRVAGSLGKSGQFPISLRTSITFQPIDSSSPGHT